MSQADLGRRLSLAAMAADPPLVASLLAQGANPLHGAPRASCPLMFAATIDGREACAELMLSAIEARGATLAGIACMRSVAGVVESSKPGAWALAARMRAAAEAFEQAKEIEAGVGARPGGPKGARL